MNFKSVLSIFGVILLLGIFSISFFKKNKNVAEDFMPPPTQGEIEVFVGQQEGEGNGNAREDWNQMIHRAAPGTDWKKMDRKFRNKLFNERNGLSPNLRTTETFANGALQGEWIELGSNNQAGNLTTIDYDKIGNKIYGISAGGVMWSGNLDGTGWQVLDERSGFRNGILRVVDNAGTKHIVAAIGKDLYYSTDNGTTWTASTMNVNSVDNWGEPTEMVALDDGTIYYLRRAWDSGPWAARMWLYRSTDHGVNFTHIATFDPIGTQTVNSTHTQLWLPLGSTTLFLLHQGKDLYSIDGTQVELRNSNSDLPQEAWVDFEGNIIGTDTSLFALMYKKDVYKSTDMGATWTMQATTPVNSWNTGFSVSPWDTDKMYFGAVECWRSEDAGNNWAKVTRWWKYYSELDSLHADIMDIQSFETTGGSEFTLVANHGGLHISYDDMVTTTNIGLAGLNISQYYDVRTDPTDANYVYGGTQDQGHQRTNMASGATGPVDFTQVISGDYGHMAFSRNDQSLWTLYPFGWVTYYHNPKTSGYNSDYTLEGNHPPVSDWIYPTSETVDAGDNSIYMAGGEIGGGNGSHLVTLTAMTTSPYTITATQFGYDFRANSNSGNSPISAIEPSYVDTDRLYVATDDGTFFYSNDGGTTWNKTAGFNGPGEYWLYGATIFASKLTSNLVYFGGSGYSNPPVWKSTDGGVTFTSMSNGLPNSLVHEIVANDVENLLFAATDVGPYVYVVADDMWYPMLGTTAPIQRYYSVEFVDDVGQQIARFGTYGRGIWDFNISLAPLPVELAYFEAELVNDEEVKLTWVTESESNNNYFSIEKSNNGVDFEEIGQVPSLGNGTDRKEYEFFDENPKVGFNYYRLKQIDFDGKFEYSTIRQVKIEAINRPIAIYPNPTPKGSSIFIENISANVLLQIFDLNGKIIHETVLQQDNYISTQNWKSGTYFYQIKNQQTKENVKVGKLVVF